MYTEKLPRLTIKHKFEKAVGIAGDLPSRVIGIAGSAYFVGNVLLLARLFRFADGGNLWNGVNAHRQLAGEPLLIGKAEGVADGYAALLHRCGRQRGKADHSRKRDRG